MQEKKCAYDKCGVAFVPKTHNQRYHDPECCRKATNSRIMEDYYAKKSRRQGKVRLCNTAGCKSVLSRYNDSNICSFHESLKSKNERKDLLRMISVSQ